MLDISVRGDRVLGQLTLDVPPGTLAQKRDKDLDALLTTPLSDAAATLDVVLAAPPHRFAWPQPGKDPEGRTRFTVGGRAEGGRLVPDRHAGDEALAAARGAAKRSAKKDDASDRRRPR